MAPEEEQLAKLVADYQDRLDGTPTGAASNVPTPLLDRFEKARELMDRLSTLRATPVFASEPTPNARRISRFEIVRELGEGGYGLVFLARDPKLGRLVALKVPRPDAMLDPDLRKRFVREARLAAKIQHPNVVPVFEAGDDGPVCFLASHYVAGVTLDAWLAKQKTPCPIDLAVRAAAAIAAGLSAIHAERVLHRDLKPQNILLEECEGTGEWPEGFGTPRICDFGLARETARGPASGSVGHILGTPNYMAPEQALGKHRDLDASADVYACGAILYFLLSGRPPHEGENQAEVLAKVCREEPPRIRSLRPDVPANLEAVLSNCLAKDKAVRYRSADDFRQELLRIEQGVPTVAKLPATPNPTVRWLGRNWPVLIAVTAFAALAVVVASFALRGETTHEAAVLPFDPPKAIAEPVNARNVDWMLAARAFSNISELDLPHNDCESMIRRLETLPAGIQNGFAARHFRHCAENLKLVWNNPALQAVVPVPGSQWLIAQEDQDWYSSRRLPTAGSTFRAVKRGDWSNPVAIPALISMPIATLDGFTAIGLDGRRMTFREATRTWEAADTLLRAGETLIAADLNHTGSSLIVRQGNAHFLVEGSARVPLVLPADSSHIIVHRGMGRIAALSPSRGVMIQDFAGKVIGNEPHAGDVLAVSPGGKWVGVCDFKGMIRVWKMEDGKLSLEEQTGKSQCFLTFRNDDGFMLSASHERDHLNQHNAVVWNMLRGRAILRLPGNYTSSTPCRTPAFSADNRTAFLISVHRGLYEWDISPDSARAALPGHGLKVWSASISTDSRQIATSGDDGPVLFTNAATALRLPTQLWAHMVLVGATSFSPDGKRFATGGHDRNLMLWKTEAIGIGGEATQKPEWSRHADEVKGIRSIAWHPNGKILATVGYDSRVRIWDLSGKLLANEEAPLSHAVAANGPLGGNPRTLRAAAWNRDGTRLLVAGGADTLCLLDNRAKPVTVVATIAQRNFCGAGWAPDGKRFYAAAEEGTVFAFKPDGDILWYSAHSGSTGIRCLAVAPDGTIATGGMDGSIRFFEPESGLEIATLRGHATTVTVLAFAPDGTFLVSGDEHGLLRRWSAPPLNLRSSK